MVAELRAGIGKRIKKYRLDFKLSREELASKIGTTIPNLGNIERGEQMPTIQQLQTVINISGFPYEYWSGQIDLKDALNLRIEAGPAEKGIPYYDMDVSASNVDIFTDTPEIKTMTIKIPGMEDCELALPVFGHSMYPIYESGSIIVCKRIKDRDVIHFGEAHLIITNEQRLLKRVQQGKTKEFVLLTSDNNELGKHGKQKYESFELAKDKIKHMFLVKGSVKRNQI